MDKTRLEAFSDGVIAIIITIMVLEMKAPHGGDWNAIRALLPTFLCYVLSFTYVGIYWNNHHHMLHTVKKVNGKILWANLHLLFWLSLIPFTTGWMGEHHGLPLPNALYGFVLLMSATAYSILQNNIIRTHGGSDSLLGKAVARDWKGKTSALLYFVAITLAFWQEWAAELMYILVAIMWFIPDSRIERTLDE